MRGVDRPRRRHRAVVARQRWRPGASRLGRRVLGIVVRSGAAKLANLRRPSPGHVVARAGYEWVAVEGTVELAGPDDPLAGVDAEGLRRLLRAVFTAAGGTHDDWPTFDEVMRAERRTAVLLHPTRVYSNG